MYLSEDAPLTARHALGGAHAQPSSHNYQKQFSNIVQHSQKLLDNKGGKLEQIPEKKQASLISQQMKSGPSKQIQESLSGRIIEKVISHHSPSQSKDGQTLITHNGGSPSLLQNTAASTQVLTQTQLSPLTNFTQESPNQFTIQATEKQNTLPQTKKEKEGMKSARDQQHKNLINLENVLLIEDKLWTILESFRYLQHSFQGQRPSIKMDSDEQTFTSQLNSISQKKQGDISLLCEEWWEITHEDNLNYLDRIFKDDLVRRSVRQSIILELLSVTICYAITSEKSTTENEEQQLNINTIQSLKSLMFYTHQNFLVLIDVIIHRLPPESSHNIWAHSLQAILLNKSSKKLLHTQGKGIKGGSGIADNAAPLLVQNNEAIIGLLKLLCKSSKEFSMKTQLNKPVFQCCIGLLKKITKHSVSQVRDLLFSLLEQFTTNLLQKQHINQKSNIVDNQDENDYLPVVYPPYLPPVTQRQQDKMYTLVLDLDETLIHYFEMGAEGGHFLVRPGAEKFLKEMTQMYEVVIFTAAMQDYADWVLDQLDPHGYIKYRLYRQHATQCGPVFIKDLSKLGRDISRVIIVDNVAENFQLQPDNGIFIRSWFDDMTDTALEELGPLLKEIVRKQCTDVRVALRKFRDQMIEQLEKGITNPIMSLD